MKKIIVVLVIMCSFTTIAFAKDYVKAKDIQKVNIGDSFEAVVDKIGDPQTLVSKEATEKGIEKVVWLYHSVKLPSGAFTPAQQATDAKMYQVLLNGNPPYLVIFLDGKVAKITRQK